MQTKEITRQGIIAALYVAVTLALAPISYGALQFRLAEMLVVLAYYNRKNSIGLILGCMIANMFSELGIVDVIFGTMATAIVCDLISRQKHTTYIAATSAVVNGIIIGLQLHFVLGLPLIASAVSVAIGQMVVVHLGVMTAKAGEKNIAFRKALQIDNKNIE